MPLIIEENKIYHGRFIRDGDLKQKIEEKFLVAEYITDNHMILHDVPSIAKGIVPAPISIYGSKMSIDIKTGINSFEVQYPLSLPLEIRKEGENKFIKSAKEIVPIVWGLKSFCTFKTKTLNRFASVKILANRVGNSLWLKDKVKQIKSNGMYLHMCEGTKSMSIVSTNGHKGLKLSGKEMIVGKEMRAIVVLSRPTCLRCGLELPKETQDILDFNFDIELTKIKAK